MMETFVPPNLEERNWPRILLAGYWNVGKTCLMHRIVKKTFPGPNDYVPTLWDNSYLKIETSKGDAIIELFEAHSREEYDRLRPLSYTIAHMVIICYPCASPKGTNRPDFRDDLLQKTEEIFVEEWMRYANGAPGALARLKCDFEADGPPDPEKYWTIDWEAAEKLKTKYNMVAHYKCSALSGTGVQEMIEEASVIAGEHYRQQALKNAKRSAAKCVFL